MTTPESTLSESLLLPELRLLKISWSDALWTCEKTSVAEVCPRCATLSSVGYDRRWVTIRDGLIRDRPITLRIRKRRLWCNPCQKPFTEAIEGILPRRKSTQRLRRELRVACERMVDLKSVRALYRVSNDTIYRALYEGLRYSTRERVNNPWPTTVGLDEHGWRRREFVTMVVSHNKKNLIELVHGKSQNELREQLAHISGRENVRYVSMDMCEAFRNFSAEFFPDAKRVADKFHVLRLLSGAILKKRRSIVGSNADRKARGLLLMSSQKLGYFERTAIHRYLENHPELHELYLAKEALHRMYRTRGKRKAEIVLGHIITSLKNSRLPELARLRKTLLNWKDEILNYFEQRLTNARVEGFNCKASLVRRRAYGYRSFKHYRLRLLSACNS